MSHSFKKPLLNPVTITLLYVVSGVVWIAYSDRLLASMIDDIELMARIQTYKGWVYVLVTGMLLYLLIRLYSSRIRKTGNELRRSELKYRNLVDHSGYAILLFTRNLNIDYCSPVITKILGFDSHELSDGKSIGDFLHLDHHQVLADAVGKFGTAGQKRITLEMQWRKKAAGWVWTECILSEFNGTDKDSDHLLMLQLRDISSIRELYRQAEQSHKKFENLFQNAPVGFHINGPDKKITEINQAGLDILGYTRDEIVNRKSWTDFISTDQHALFEKRWEKIFRTGSLSDARYTVKTKNGDLVEVVKNARLLQDGSTGDFIILSNVVDVTSKNRAEELLKESETRYRFLFKSNPLPMWIYDKHTFAFIDVNDMAVEKYGYTRDEFLSMTIKDIRPEEDVPVLLQSYRKQENLHNAGIWRHTRKDGTVFQVEIIANPLVLNGREVEIVLAYDVSEKIKAETELRESEGKFRKLAETIDAVVVIYKGENFVFVNKGTERITGYTADELKTMKFWEVVHPDHQKITRENGLARQLGEEVEKSYDFKIVRKDGEVRWLSFSASAIMFEGEKAAIGTGFDITDRKMAELKISELNRDLERRVRERTSELEAVNAELEAFSYSVSHDLMAPLRGIDGFSQALLEQYDNKLDDTGRNYLTRIRSGTQKMGSLIDELLKLSRITRADMQMQDVDITAMAEQVMDDLVRSEPDRKVEFSCDDNIMIYGDRGLMKVVLANLLGNAWKFTSRKEQAEIKVKRLQNGADGFMVHDNGAGFNMQYYSKLFSPFQRLHKSSEFEGTGIGLATVLRVIKKHGGTIEAVSVIDAGSTFTVKLPAGHTAPGFN
ncbi:MAG: PAS domain S-box protein [Balneolaceae bacterium]|nr:MAG: PAS domain S-box protein [Balneolaceae bacterium]